MSREQPRLHTLFTAGLHWVGEELEQSLVRARQLIEQHAESPDDPLPLQQAVGELHAVRGTASMVQCYGVAALAEEMKQTLQALLQPGAVREPELAYSGLMSAAVQLSDYIDALTAGFHDCVLVLQPVINELRLVCGRPVFTEQDLFVAQMSALAVLPRAAELPVGAGGSVQEQARRLLPTYRASLLAWLRGTDSKLHLARLGRIAELVAAPAQDPATGQLWRCVAACVEALLAHTLEDSLDLKRLFGRAGQALRQLAEQGEPRPGSAAAAEALDDHLIYRLLFFVGRSRGGGRRAAALRRQYELNVYLPPAGALEELRQRLHGPNTQLLDRVAAEIRADLAQIKDNIDLAVRAGPRASGDLAPTRERLNRVANTLSVLGLTVLQRVIANQARVLEDLRPDDAGARQTWMDFATAVLRVEHSLEDALFRQLRRLPVSAAPPPAELDEEVPHLAGVREGVDALLRESLVNIAKLKAQVDAFIKNGDASGLGEGASLLAEIASGFRILEREPAARLIDRLREFLTSPVFPTLPQEPALAERFAEAVAAIEFFIEVQRDRLPLAERLLEDLTGFLDRLGAGEEAVIARAVEGPLAAQAADTVDASEEPAAKVEPAAPPVAVDAEIREVFLDEAGEVLQTLQRALPKWRRDPTDRELLTEIRRAFHTLKGSGRMVGAAAIGEFGWSLESLLNRCLDGTIEASPRVVELVREAVQLLPQLVTGYRDGQAPPPALDALCERARALASGRDDQSEADIGAVFRHDALERLQLVSRWMRGLDRAQRQHEVPAEVVRAFHTLLGAAHVVNAPHIAEVAGSLETYLDALIGAGLDLPAEGLQLLDEIVDQLYEWVPAVGQAGAEPADPRPWLERIQAVQAALPVTAVHAVADRRLSEVFAVEALELVQKAEEIVGGWSRAPDARFHARDLKAVLHTLRGAALMSNCGAIGQAAQALRDRLDGFAEGAPPTPAFFDALARLLEGYYQALDAYREGRLDGEGEALLAATRALDSSAAACGVAIAVPPEPLAPAEPARAGPAATPAVEALLSMAPAASAFIELPAPPGIDGQVTEAESFLELELPASAPDSAPAAAQESMELSLALPVAAAAPSEAAPVAASEQTLFAATVAEYLDAVDQLSATLEAQPDEGSVLQQLGAQLQGLKEAARGAGVAAIADIAQRLEARVQSAAGDAALPDARFFAELQNGADGLQLLLDQLRRGELLDAAAVLAELGPAADLAAVEAWTSPSGDAQRWAGPPSATADVTPAAEASALSAPESLTTPAAGAVPIDRELIEIFSAEAAELLEMLERALTAWNAQPDDDGALRDLQRALHTLKGGARMAGLTRLGSAAHEMESRVNDIETGRLNADEAAHARLAADLEILQAMHDRLARGDYAGLVAQPAPAQATQPAEPKTAAGPEPAAPRAAAPGSWDPQLFWQPQDDERLQRVQRRETARVSVETLDGLLNQVGEISIYRSRLEEHNVSLRSALAEMTQTIARLREQLRLMDIETEAQIAARGLSSRGADDRYESEFDPLEMDRYSRMQELSRALAESVGDLASLHTSMDEVVGEADTLLQQQGRINTEVQAALMGTLMVPFSRQVQRLQRVVRQVAQDQGKQAEIVFRGIESELDRNVLERMVAPLEHLLRNSVVHGIEPAEVRVAAGKPPAGAIAVELRREGAQLLVELRDDGRGLDIDAIRQTAIHRGLMPAGAQLSDEDVAQFIFAPGFSTAQELTQDAGRGVGMDVVAAEVKQLGGTLELGSEPGRGVRFLIRLPLSLAVSQALLVRVGEESYALPLAAVEGIVRIPREKLADHYRDDGIPFSSGGYDYRVRYLGDFIGVPRSPEVEQKTAPAILVRLGEGLGGGDRRIAVVVDQLIGNHEIVLKAAGPLVSSIVGLSGATILADGQVVLILDIAELAQDRARRALLTQAARGLRPAQDERDLVMVVDDSITMRRVAERLLLRNGFRVSTAKDGLDAMARLQTETPVAVLLDIEMPRADGFEVAAFMRNTGRLARTPIVIITSRSGEKHRERARSLGVNRYLIKPYQEDQLMSEVRSVIAETAVDRGAG